MSESVLNSPCGVWGEAQAQTIFVLLLERTLISKATIKRSQRIGGVLKLQRGSHIMFEHVFLFQWYYVGEQRLSSAGWNCHVLWNYFLRQAAWLESTVSCIIILWPLSPLKLRLER